MPENLHSQLVGWSKILLPMAALALLSTMFLFAQRPAGQQEIPIAGISERARDQQITAPQFSGVTTDGGILQISARAAQPQNEGIVVIDQPTLTLNTTDGTTLRIVAGTGQIDQPNRRAELTGLARLETSSGYLMETAGLTADIETGEVRSQGPLEIQSPMGALTAGSVVFRGTAEGGVSRMDFTEGVKLVYLPGAQSE